MTQEKRLQKEEIKEEWTKDQDALLQNLVSLYGTHDWAIVAENINATFPLSHKTSKECSGRWQEFLSGNSTKEPWSEQEELNMILAHKKYKNRWSDMSDSLKGRSNNTIKNKFYSVFRKIKGKIQKNDYSYDSKLELLEIHYIISLIEYYLAHPTQNPKTKGKRGKDFIYSLIHNLTAKGVQEYKQKIQELTKNEGTMEDLMVELTARFKVPGQSQGENMSAGGMAPMHVPARPRLSPEDREGKVQAPAFTSAIDSAATVRSTAALGLDDDLFNKDAMAENSPLFEPDPVGQPFLFSPTTLSAGPAAAAAGAAKAACFGHPAGGFSEFSNALKTLADDRRSDQTPPVTKTAQCHRTGALNYGTYHHEGAQRPMSQAVPVQYAGQFYGNASGRSHYYISQQ